MLCFCSNINLARLLWQIKHISVSARQSRAWILVYRFMQLIEDPSSQKIATAYESETAAI